MNINLNFLSILKKSFFEENINVRFLSAGLFNIVLAAYIVKEIIIKIVKLIFRKVLSQIIAYLHKIEKLSFFIYFLMKLGNDFHR